MPNFVTVTAMGINADGSAINQMRLSFLPSDMVWSDEFNLIGGIQPVYVQANGQLLQFTWELYAMDNAGVSDNWYWVMSGTINGIEILPRKLIVNFANGATQNLSTLLDASTVITT